MEKFVLGETKILVSTSIVESGLDIQNANTIIIQEVQLFGLAQLYQVLFFLI
jgi:transcription-repair coupling factor (superfamily II helicase)